MAGIKPFLLALAAVAVSAQDPSNFTISHSCIILADGNWRMELTIDGRGNQVDRVQAVNASEAPQEILCDNTPAGGGNAVQEFTALDGSDTFFFRADIVTSSGAVTPDCGQLTSPDEGLTVGEYKWFVKVESDAFHPDIQLAFEKTYIITCDFNDPASTRNETIDTIVQVNNPPTPEVIDLQKDGDLDIVLADNFSPVNTIASGTLTRIKAFLVTENVAPVNPPRTGVSPYNCRACRDDACSGTVIQLTDIDGCVVGNTLSASFTNTVGPEMSPNGDVLYSGTFEIFSFSESLNSPVGNVVFTCKFDYCDSTTGPALCTNRCTTRTGGRKRREVSLDHKSRNIRESGVTTAPSSGDKTGDDVSVTVKVVKDTLMRERNPVTGQFLNGGVEVKMVNSPRTITRKDDDELCNGHTGFIAGACILGVSLVVAVAACVFFCVKISRVRSEKAGSLGHSNLAFQQH